MLSRQQDLSHLGRISCVGKAANLPVYRALFQVGWMKWPLSISIIGGQEASRAVLAQTKWISITGVTLGALTGCSNRRAFAPINNDDGPALGSTMKHLWNGKKILDVKSITTNEHDFSNCAGFHVVQRGFNPGMKPLRDNLGFQSGGVKHGFPEG